jgi:hypothetical protein
MKQTTFASTEFELVTMKSVNQKNIISSGELLSMNYRFCGGLFRATLASGQRG